MKLIKFTHEEDYGHDLYVQILFNRRWAFFQGIMSWCEYAGWPYLQIKFGMGSLIYIVFNAHKFGLCIGLFERTWRVTGFDSADGVL